MKNRAVHSRGRVRRGVQTATGLIKDAVCSHSMQQESAVLAPGKDHTETMRHVALPEDGFAEPMYTQRRVLLIDSEDTDFVAHHLLGRRGQAMPLLDKDISEVNLFAKSGLFLVTAALAQMRHPFFRMLSFPRETIMLEHLVAGAVRASAILINLLRCIISCIFKFNKQ
jgi:hypothetical protein